MWRRQAHQQLLPKKSRTSRSYLARGKLSDAVKKLEKQLVYGRFVRLDDLNYVIQALGKEKDPKTAQRFYDLSVEHGMKPTFITRNSLLSAYAQSGDSVNAVKIFNDMKENGASFKPNLHSYNFIIDSFARQGKVKQASHWLEKCAESKLRPDQITFGSLMKAYAKLGHTRDAALLLQRMVDSDLKPDKRIFSSVLTAHAKRGDAQGVLDIINKAPNNMIDIFAYHSAMHAFARNGEFIAAEEMLAKLEASNLKADLHIYNALLDAYSRMGNIEGAQNVMERMFRADITPDIISHSCIMSSFANAGDLNGALAYLDEVLVNENVQVDVQFFGSIFNLCGRAGNISACEKLLETMHMLDLTPDVSIYNSLFFAYSYCKDVSSHHSHEKLLTLFEKIDEPNGASFRAITEALLNFKLPEVAGELLFKYFQKGGIRRVRPVTEHFNYILCYYSKGEDLHNVTTFLDRMIDEKVPLEAGCYNHVLAVLTKAIDIHTAEKYFDDLSATEFGPDAYSFANMITIYAKVNRPEQARKLLHRMFSENIKPDRPIFNSIITKFRARRQH